MSQEQEPVDLSPHHRREAAYQRKHPVLREIRSMEWFLILVAVGVGVGAVTFLSFVLNNR